MARLAVFGARGATGREVLRLAVADGHEVVAVTRDPAGLTVLSEVEVRQGDLLDESSLAGVLDGVDAVVSAVGPDDGRRPTQVYSSGMQAILRQMRSAGVRRVVAVSAVPVSAPADKTVFERLVLHPILWHFFGESYRDLRAMEAELARADDLDWAVVRPPLLTDDPRDHPLRTAWDGPVRRPGKVSRRLLARTLVDTALADPFRSGILTITQA